MKVSAWVKGTALLVITFATGVAVGMMHERRQEPPASVAADAHAVRHRLAQELNLDPAQLQAISEILARRQADVDATWDAIRPHMRAALDSTSQEIIAVLRPDQADKYRKMIGRVHGPHH
jgi:hypothetical protein